MPSDKPCLLRRPGPPEKVEEFTGVQIDDERLERVIERTSPLLCLYEHAAHGEGPLWLPAQNRFIWSDIPIQRIMTWYPDDGRVVVEIARTHFINANAIDRQGRVVHCEHGRRCISRSDGRGGAVPIVTHFEGRRLNSPNDVTVAADGAVWFTDPTFGLLMPNQGSLVEPELDHRSVYRFDPATGELRRMADFEQPNGLFFSPDGRTLYVSDTARSLGEIIGGHERDTHEIIAFDVAADGTLSGRRFFLRTDHGYPDGFAVDERGWIWSSSGDGIQIYAPDRTKLGFFPTPMTPANCCFGGENMKRFFVAAKDYLLAIDLR